jgi:hypothetical protein
MGMDRKIHRSRAVNRRQLRLFRPSDDQTLPQKLIGDIDDLALGFLGGGILFCGRLFRFAFLSMI